MLPQFVGNTADAIWRQAAQTLTGQAHRQDSRLGLTRELLHCTFLLTNPRQRWVLSRQPALNPAFAIAEVVWILRGHDDAGFPKFWNPALSRFVGEGDRYHGAYGHRLRSSLDLDQLERAWQALSANPDSRQVVLQIWDSNRDFPHADGRARDPDIPCNICSMPKVREGRLEWLQIMRSNDLFLGTPHNFVQFTVLQEVMAGWLGLEPGNYVQVSDSLHLYENGLTSMSVAETPPPLYPEESLALPKAEFEQVLECIGDAMDRLRAKDLKPEEVRRMTEAPSVPEAWANLLRIAAADATRRRGWQDDAMAAAATCTNAGLRASWEAWRRRMLGQV